MSLKSEGELNAVARSVVKLTKDWGDWNSVSLYLNRCRVDTPIALVDATWTHVRGVRQNIEKVVDFGAGDGRFSRKGEYVEYVGYEIDSSLCHASSLPNNATLLNRCAFSDEISDADLCIGNPPYVRNQDLPSGWRQRVSGLLNKRTGVALSGLANAWQYFFLHALVSTTDKGLCALIVPYEWVSRPSAKALRSYIMDHCWNVKVYRLVDTKFHNVLTTSSITIIDKALSDGKWTYFEETSDEQYAPMKSPTGAEMGVLQYIRKQDIPWDAPIAMRGLSPGTQKVLTLNEGDRVRNGLEIDLDVVPCVTSLRPLPYSVKELNTQTFQRYYRNTAHKCWLIRTDVGLSEALRDYLDSVPASAYQTATCLGREKWWRFIMPAVPSLLVAQGFKGNFPKAVKNCVNARAVGGVCGVFNIGDDQIDRIVIKRLGGIDLRDRIIAYSNGYRKIEINQWNSLLKQDYEAGNTDG